MTASSIFFLGKVIRRPGVYSETDASGLEGVALGATGVVAVLGTAEGGRPVSAITEVKDLLRFYKPEAMRKTFRSGDLREVGGMLFEPGKDVDVPAGAAEVIAMKVNPATQSAASFANAQGDAMDVTSADYGEFTSQINISIADGTTQGKLITITFEDDVESEDNIGGDDIFNLTYVAHAKSWDAMTGQVLSGGSVECNGTRDEGGLDADMTQPGAATALEVVSSDAGDTTQEVEVWGLDGSSNVLYSKVTLTGLTAVDFSGTFTKVLGARKSAASVGTVTVQADGGGAAVCALAPATLTQGLVEGVAMFVNAGKLDFVADGATTKDVIIQGLSASGAVQRERVQLNGATGVQTVGDYSAITVMLLGDVEAARTLTFSAEAAESVGTTQTTIQKAADYFNAKKETYGGSDYGFTLTVATGLTSFAMSDLDVMVSAVSVLNPADPGFTADLWAVIDWINQNSQYVTAAAATGASGGAPSNTVAPIFLTGGGEGTTTSQHWQDALNLLKQVRVNTVVPLTGDPAVHAMCDAHCAYMGGLGRSERDFVAGALNAGLTDVPTKDEYKAQVVDLNTRHARLVGQAVERFDSAGERSEFLPPFHAAVIAGMQAGSSVGTSLTSKYANVLALRQHATWNPIDDAEEMIAGGCCFMEAVDGVGRRVVRNVTTHLSSSNVAFTEASVNEASNFISYEFRQAMQIVVGKKGFAGTVNAGKSAAINKLGLLIDEEAMVAHQALNIELIVDTLEMSVQVAPAVPINFVPITIHLITIRQSAA